ncbi:zinc-binding alcohol dehydrogenase family protein [Chitinophaga ginsengisoli]|uniref:2-desacetyl-2-hydroxyethyl bacteriochlorophyllide A dehydrogenase n=1 Tax=Chitinophaga ginsengisoli TaxID=363837 RepID=A0A2P8G538_9BACT|nr:zinc-binding alcohol dehydrogenase family protein [Chitinophaga ginsengisoli]PSL29089.1 2-desacetyl-2-hydroxyethyl bacteriochlorophyllide A dehydrogenase [Chitinophaga ginsengisoli]
MRTIICEEPGKLVLKQKERLAPGEGYAQIRIRRIGVCGTDLHAFEGTQPYFSYPRILGHELSGELVECNGAPGFKNGDIVTFIPYFNCGACIACKSGKPNCCVKINVCGVHVDGGMTEYLNVPISALVHGDGLSYDDLALVEPLAIGAHSIRRAAVKPGEFVLVIGAGPIGLGVMEFARIAGGNVIALDVNAKRLAFSRDNLKVAHVINASTDNVLDQLSAITKGEMPTVVIDATGNLKAINNGFQYMAHGGRYVLVGLQKGDICMSHPEFHKREATLMSSRNATREDFYHVIGSIKSGLVQPGAYITHRIAFENVTSEFESLPDPSNGVIKAVIELE